MLLQQWLAVVSDYNTMTLDATVTFDTIVALFVPFG
jgi:hypothetical protein